MLRYYYINVVITVYNISGTSLEDFIRATTEYTEYLHRHIFREVDNQRKAYELFGVMI
jgi:hypothetical protein